MLRTKALRKIFITTLSMFILLTAFSLPTFQSEQSLRTNLEVDTISNLPTSNIYLLNKENFLVKSKIFLTEQNPKDKIRELLNNLIIKSNNKIPKNTKINDIFISDDLITIDFSSEFLTVSATLEKPMISSIVYSLLDLYPKEGISILINGVPLNEYPNSKEKLPLVLTKKIGINNKYQLSSRDNISKVVIY